MLEMAFDCWNWTIRSVNRFEVEHWVTAFAVLLTIGFVTMRGLGARGK